jgi:hypothetical protein
MKIVKWVVLGVVALVIVGLLVVYFNLNGIVKRTVETQGTAQLNVKTTLDSAALSLFGGSLKLDDLAIASPQGYQAPQMLSVDDAKMEVSWGQLRQDPIHVQSIRIEAPKLVVEQAGGKLNFQALMDQATKTPEKPPGQEKEPVHVIIDKLTINNASVALRPGIPGLAQEYNIPLPMIDIEKVGTGEGNQNGAAIKEVVMEVVTVMVAKAAESDKLPPEVRAILNGGLKDIIGNVKNEAVKRITAEVEKKLPAEATKALEGVMKDPNALTTNPSGVVEGLGGLLNQKKDAKKEAAPTPSPAPTAPKKKKGSTTQPVTPPAP